MLHIATVHFETPRWIEVQARELRRNISVPYQTWASLEGVHSSHGVHFDRTVEHSGTHADKLNRLADQIVREAADDDLLMFLDGDAFPVADPLPLIESGLRSAPLMAVRRDENFNDPQPHPCFCVTRVDTWRSLPGDWREGHCWPGPLNQLVTDPGARLLRRLESKGIAWTKVLRSNGKGVHPLFYGIYGNVIYHHGAGFRDPFSRADLALLEPDGATLVSAARAVIERNRRQSQALFEKIERDDPGWLAEIA